MEKLNRRGLFALFGGAALATQQPSRSGGESEGGGKVDLFRHRGDAQPMPGDTLTIRAGSSAQTHVFSSPLPYQKD